MTKYTFEQLDNKSIYEVRDIAREVGVPSATEKKKDELIDLILKITNCEMEVPKPPKRGRPRKEPYNREER
ncbi:MAG: Rho termination factor N-terminal domain-containing protein, partial [Clostridia bacterium]|nr:Rho termination factor N-terminal domain-containing protein [Clostridia bacterium]